MAGKVSCHHAVAVPAGVSHVLRHLSHTKSARVQSGVREPASGSVPSPAAAPPYSLLLPEAYLQAAAPHRHTHAAARSKVSASN